MTDAEYLNAVLRGQIFPPKAPELADLEQHKDDVTSLLNEHFADARPTIRRGGSWAKGTMIRASYDLDLPCYFGADEDGAGASLKEIFHNVESALREDYWTEAKTSAIRLRSRETTGAGPDFHIDVVPGRFFDDTETDVWLYQNIPDRERLKTNLDTHVAHVKKSGVTDAIRLMKLWRVTRHVDVRNFVLELMTIDLLKDRKAVALPVQMHAVLESLRDNAMDLVVEDPANPKGNDLSSILTDGTRRAMQLQAQSTLAQIGNAGWESVFGAVAQEDRAASLARAAAAVPAAGQNRPWVRG